MCLILFAVNSHPRYPLVIAANRDEFHDRPSAPAGFWPDRQRVWGGRDLRSGGSWLAVSGAGRLAMVTNVREGVRETRGRSRGELVRDFVLSEISVRHWLQQYRPRAGDYPGFNLVAGSFRQLYYWSNRQVLLPERLPDGIHGLSNGRLDAPWPKVQRGCGGLQALLQAAREPEAVTGEVFRLLADRTPVADDDLPATGVPLEWERLLAPIFVCSPRYGTRCSTVVLLERN
ncbi:MAG: NRDE family protein, partial [Deltaproteobacteria bacterium]